MDIPQKILFPTNKIADSYHIDIWIAGNYEDAQRTCRKFCSQHGFCVTVRPVEYIYTGGQEAGVVVSIINYPRFPRVPGALIDFAYSLTSRLMTDLCQESASIETPERTFWVSNRVGDDSPSKRS